jgi:hypothetical protein
LGILWSVILHLSSIRFREYYIGTLRSMPALFGYLVTGNLAGAGVQASTAGPSTIRISLLSAELLATEIATSHIGRITTAAIGYRPLELEANSP